MMESLNIDQSNVEMQQAYNMIAETKNSFFLTGKAGSGKTTFLKAIQKEINKRFMVLAPTGTAAILADGTTIHSALGFKPGILGPHDVGEINYVKQQALRCVDTIIIDEVSMVRCDIMDAINRTLCEIRQSSLPFGGVQMVFVGDVFQLPPVRKPAETAILKDLYPESNDFFFFDANVFEIMSLPRIELKKVYRQSDSAFISLLDKFRTGQIKISELQYLNSIGLSALSNAQTDTERITLTIRNDAAREINTARLNAIDSKQYEFMASYNGDCSALKGVAETQLTLKVGAQVMFTRNAQDRSYSNGSIGTISKISEEGIYVQYKEREVLVEQVSWDAIDYLYNKETRHIEKVIVGRLTQFPLRLAWAITIHKSQGQTFDKVYIDFGSGAFTYGQVYVALSRARSLDGIALKAPIGMNSVIVSDDALTFAKLFNNTNIINNEMVIGVAINDYLSKKDYDGAARKLVEIAIPAMSNGDIVLAYTLMNRALTYVIDDDKICLDSWTECRVNSYEAFFLNGVGYFFCGDYQKSLEFLNAIDSNNSHNLNLIYVKARCYEKLQIWKAMNEAYGRVNTIIFESIYNGLDAVAFRKCFFRTANKSEVGFRNIKALISELPTYIPYHIALRKIYFTSNNNLIEPTCENTLIADFMCRDCSNETFENLLRQEFLQNTSCVSEYQRFIQKINDVKINKVQY